MSDCTYRLSLPPFSEHPRVATLVRQPMPGIDPKLLAYVIYRCVVGSRAYGLDDTKSDTDTRGFFLPPAELHWSLAGAPEQLEDAEADVVFWEAEKFVRLALKGNPNVLECLYTPLIEHATPLARELLDMRDRFLSRRVYHTYNGYVQSQFKKLQTDLRNTGEIKWKHVMHLLRLLKSGITLLKEARVVVNVGEDRDRLLAVRRGEVSFLECETLWLKLREEFDLAFAGTNLPEYPDEEAASAWLIRARRAMVAE